MSIDRDSLPRGQPVGGPRGMRQVGHYGILATVLAAPLAIGGARPEVQVALEVGVLATFTVWLIARRGDMRLPPFGAVMALALAGTVLQVVPLPAGLLGVVSPRTLEIVSDARGGRPAFLPISLDVPGTLLAAGRGLACACVLLVTAAATRRGKSRSFAIPVAFCGAVVAILSFVQRATNASTILGFYQVAEMPGSGFFGTFVSGNHAAAFFTIAALLAWGAARECEGPLRVALATAALIAVAALFSTGSRFGIIGLAAGSFVVLALWLLGRFGTTRGLAAAAGIGLVVLPLAMALALAQRGSATELPLGDFKLRGFRDALGVIAGFPMLGVGRGAFEAPAAAFRENTHGVRLVFPENLALQGAAEWGLPLFIVLLGLLARTAWVVAPRLPRWEPLPQAAAAAVVAALVHDLADFSLEVLGVALPAALALGLLAGRRQMSQDQGGASSRGIAAASSTRARLWGAGGTVATGIVLLAGAGWAASRTSDADAKRVRAAMAARARNTEALIGSAVRRHPAEHDFALLAAHWGMRSNPPAPDTLRHLNRAQRLFPSSGAPHLSAAHLLARLGRPAQAAVELRLARERGLPLGYDQIERLVGPSHLDRAVPRTVEQMFELATHLVRRSRVAEGRKAADRAVMFAENSEASLARRMLIAEESGDPTFIKEAALALGRAPTAPESLELATRGLARAGELEAARALVRRVPTLFPHQPGLVVSGARALLKYGDSAGARAVIVENVARHLPVSERIAAEELLAAIAEKEGDNNAAAAARARARILGHLRDQGRSPP